MISGAMVFLRLMRKVMNELIPTRMGVLFFSCTLILVIMVIPVFCYHGHAEDSGELYRELERQQDFDRDNHGFMRDGIRGSSFRVSVSQMFDQQGQSLLVVNTWIAYGKLVFFKVRDHYESHYRVYISILDEDDNHLEGKVLEKTVVSSNYQDTRRSSSVSTHKELIPIKNGEYTVKVDLEVVDTSLRFEREVNIRVVGADMDRFELSEPLFSNGREDSTSARPPEGEILISVCPRYSDDSRSMKTDKVYSGFINWPRVSYTLGGIGKPKKSDTSYIVVSTEIKNDRDNVLLYNRKLLRPYSQSHLQFCLEFDSGTFFPGRYKISTVVRLWGEDTRASSRSDFMVLFSSAMLDIYFEETLGLLSLFAEESELDILRNSSPEGRKTAWKEFWKQRAYKRGGLLPSTEDQFFQRLKFIQLNFADFGEGWKTDRGRIYLRYGQPDQVEQDSDRYGIEYILWYYYSRGELYIFRDTAGGGNFKLVDTRMI
jgi:GWxTD domain-containing protein